MSVLIASLVLAVHLCLGEELDKQRILGLALLYAGTDNVTDRGDRQNGTVLFGIDISPVYGLSLLGGVYVVLHLGTVAIRYVTEAVGSKEQGAGLSAPISRSDNLRKNDLVLYAGGKLITQLCNRIDLKNTALVGSSSTNQLAGAPS